MVCPKNLIEPFTMFIINDGYLYQLHGNSVRFSKESKKQLKIDCNGRMNASAQERYSVFIKVWFRIGAEFINNLRTQFNFLVRRLNENTLSASAKSY